MTEERIGKYLRAVQLVRPMTRKTDTWSILSNDGDILGSVRWYGPWRQYVFCPVNAIFNAGCLKDIVAFLNRVNGERK